MKAERLGLRAGDGVIYAVLVLLCAALFLLPLLRDDDAVLTAQIMADGEVIETVELSLSAMQTFEETREVNGCVIVLSPEGVCVADADCPDRLCVKTGMITRAGEAIACVPNRVVVTLRQARAADETYDGVAY
jgi:hypothetical protein